MGNCNETKQKIRVGLLFGSVSSEHEVSLVSAAAWAGALGELTEKYEVILVGITKAGRWLRYSGPIDAIRDGSWERDASCVPCVISPDRGDHGLLVRTPNGCRVERLDVASRILHGKDGEEGTIEGLLELAGIRRCAGGIFCAPLGQTYGARRIHTLS